MGDREGMITKHPTEEQLVAFVSNKLEGSAAIATAAHLEKCRDCTGSVARFRLVGEVLRATDYPEPPLAVVARAKRLFTSNAPDERESEGDRLAGLRRVVARLVFDSGAGLSTALAGFRGGGERHLTYVAGDVQVDLRLWPPAEQGGAWRVQGQVDANSHVAATAIDMVRPGEEHVVAWATTDAHGMFNLAAPAGHYDILVRLPHVLQVLPGLELG